MNITDEQVQLMENLTAAQATYKPTKVHFLGTPDQLFAGSEEVIAETVLQELLQPANLPGSQAEYSNHVWQSECGCPPLKSHCILERWIRLPVLAKRQPAKIKKFIDNNPNVPIVYFCNTIYSIFIIKR